ncbi:hypothetical protein ACLKA6_000936 [Drosophila palustris]
MCLPPRKQQMCSQEEYSHEDYTSTTYGCMDHYFCMAVQTNGGGASSNLERKTKHTSKSISSIGEELYTCRHSNSFYKLQRIVAYMLRTLR